MVKQAACAAAMSSSGLVLPSGSPNRDATVMGRSLSAPLCPDARPEPRAMLPVQSISAVRCTAEPVQIQAGGLLAADAVS
jgi:hypothetical protein